jgi:hypothetical protein
LIGAVTSGSGSSSCVIASVGDRVIKEVEWGMEVWMWLSYVACNVVSWYRWWIYRSIHSLD